MSGERYFPECHIPGYELPSARIDVSEDPQLEKHLHITVTRPFTIPDGKEESIKQTIIEYCRGKKPIHYILEGKDRFPGSDYYIPVESQEMLDFDSGLEKALEGDVIFDTRLGKKTLHLTIDESIDALPRTEIFMLRLTCMKHDVIGDKKVKIIWFSFDFVTQKDLNKEESLDEVKWQRTKELYEVLK